MGKKSEKSGKTVDKKEFLTVGKWILNKIDTKDWRAGKGLGSKHYKHGSKGSDKSRDNILEMMEAVGGRQNFLGQVQELEREGLISVLYANVNQDVKEITFPLENADALFQYEKLENPRRVIEERKQFLKKQLERATGRWQHPYYESLYDKLENGTIDDNVRDENIFLIINALSALEKDVWKRKFSSDVLGASKAFETKYEGRILTILKNHSPKAQDTMKNVEILAEHGILTYSQTLEWKGGIIYRVEGRDVDTSPMCYGTVLNAQTLSHGEPVSLGKVKKIITIENKANYEEQKYNPEILYIYTHGFLSPKERLFLERLEELAESSVEFYHWGDMDYGGIRIFQFMKEKLFPKLEPLFMDRETYEKALREKEGIPLEDGKRERLERLNAEELEELKQCILKYGVEFEQESIME